MLSIVIPLFNAEKTIGLVLQSITNSKLQTGWEIIIVDDGSDDNSKFKISTFFRKMRDSADKQNLKLFTQKHKGPAAARNLGAKKAQGNILVFLDADVVLERQALYQINHDFITDRNLVALNGVYSLRPANPSFFTWYFSLFKYYQWVFRKTKEYTGFSTRLAAIRKSVFLKLGGFNENYQEALVEDYEFGHRLGRSYKVLVDPKVAGKHFHPSFKQCFKNYYQRVYLWLKLFGKRKQFDSITTTVSTGMGSGFGFASLFFLLLVLFYPVSILFTVAFIGAIIFFLWFYRRFHSFVFKKKGFFWMIAAIVMSLILTIPIGMALLKFLLVDKLAFKARKAVV